MKWIRKLSVFIFMMALSVCMIPLTPLVHANEGTYQSVVPPMTANNAPAPYVVSSSSSYGAAYYPFKAFDGIISGIGNRWVSATATGWIKIDLGNGNERVVSKYSIRAIDSISDLQQPPKNWTLEASNTGAFSGEQVIIDTRSNQTSWTKAERREFVGSNSDKYRFYRINITQNNGAAAVSITEMELFEPDLTRPGDVNAVTTGPNTQDSIKIQWINPLDEDFKEVRIFEGTTLIKTVPGPENSTTITGLLPSTTKTYTLKAVDYTGNVSDGVTLTATTAADETPPAEVSNISTTVFSDRIKMTWTLPPDNDFVEVRIFKDGKLHAIATTPATSFTDYDLTAHTTYTYLLRSRDTSMNMSSGVTVTATTVGPPKTSAVGVNGNVGSTKVNVYFSPSTDPTVTGYNIYQDGLKIAGPITEMNYLIEGLNNDQSYTFYVTAENQWGESVASNEITLTPKTPEPIQIKNLRVAETKKSYIKFSWDHDLNAEKYIGTVTIKKLQVEAMGFSMATATEPTETTTNFETTENVFLVDNLDPGDTVTLTVSAYNTELGQQTSVTISGTTSIADGIDDLSVPITGADVVINTITLVGSLASIILLALCIFFAPRIIDLIKNASS